MKRFLLAVAALSLALTARAQWTAASVPTTENLWGVCYGANQFVAVGTAGTILTSADGATWTAHTSGTTTWLLAICYAQPLNLYVGVGDHGTILTSPDAVTWTLRSSGTTARLNGVAFGGGRFLAVGEDGVATTSSDGLTWQSGNSGVTVFLRGVTYGHEQFVVSGGAGALLSTTDGLHFARLGIATHGAIEALAWDGSTCLAVGEFNTIARSTDLKNWTFSQFTTRSYLRGIASFGGHSIAAGTPDGQTTLWVVSARGFEGDNLGVPAVQLNAVAVGSSAVVAVGVTGTICRWSLPASPPVSVQVATSDFFYYVGQNITLAAAGTAPSALPLLYQWFHDGIPIAGATTATLSLSNLRKSDTGKYDVTVSNALGSASTLGGIYSYSMTVALPPRWWGSRDSSFSTPLTVSPWAVAVQPDGRIVVAAPMFFYPGGVPQYGLARLYADGSLDPTFRLTSGGVDFGDTISDLTILPDGRIIVIGTLSSLAGSHGPFNWSTLNADGSLDRAKNPSSIFGNHSTVPLTDGRTVDVAIETNVVTLTRRLANGTPDASYPGFTFSLAPRFDWPWGSVVITPDASGGILVATSSSPSGPPGGDNQARLFRLLANGELDPSFPLAPVNDVITKMIPIAGNIYYQSKWVVPYWYGDFRQKFGRLHADGSADPAYQPIELSAGRTSNWPPADLCADGSVIAGWFGGLARFTAFNSAYATPLVNLSIRTTAGTGDQTLIAGFVIAGDPAQSRSVLLRGVGPGLIPLGIRAADALADPLLILHRGSSTIASNDDWDPSLDAQATALGAFPLTPGSKDAALLAPLAPGAYTALVTHSGSTPASGIALVELYDADPAPTSASSPRLVNLSGRAHVGTGDNVLIAGFVIAGHSTKRVLIRAVGPGLLAQGVSDALLDPELSVHHGAETVDENDNWNSADADTFKTVGAFPLATGSKDAALVLDLAPGVYTAVVKGVNDSTGTALVELYEVP